MSIPFVRINVIEACARLRLWARLRLLATIVRRNASDNGLESTSQRARPGSGLRARSLAVATL